MSRMPHSMKLHDERRLHWSLSSMLLHFSFAMKLVCAQQPGTTVVVGVSVVVITQSSGSSVTRKEQPISSQRDFVVALPQRSLAL